MKKEKIYVNDIFSRMMYLPLRKLLAKKIPEKYNPISRAVCDILSICILIRYVDRKTIYDQSITYVSMEMHT